MISVASIRGWHAAAASSGLSATSLRRLVASGRLAARRGDDGVWEFELHDLEALRTGGARAAARTTDPRSADIREPVANRVPDHDADDRVGHDDAPGPLGQSGASGWPPSADELRLRGYERVVETAQAAQPATVSYYTTAPNSIALPISWRNERVNAIAYAIAMEIAQHGWWPAAVHHAGCAVAMTLNQLDDAWLASSYTIEIARRAAATALASWWSAASW